MSRKRITILDLPSEASMQLAINIQFYVTERSTRVITSDGGSTYGHTSNIWQWVRKDAALRTDILKQSHELAPDEIRKAISYVAAAIRQTSGKSSLDVRDRQIRALRASTHVLRSVAVHKSRQLAWQAAFAASPRRPAPDLPLDTPVIWG